MPTRLLSPALLLLLQTSVLAQTTDARELAALLFLSPETVRTEWTRICERLGAHSRYAAALIGLEQGLVTLNPPAQSPGSIPRLNPPAQSPGSIPR